jgi:hypothetical protein
MALDVELVGLSCRPDNRENRLRHLPNSSICQTQLHQGDAATTRALHYVKYENGSDQGDIPIDPGFQRINELVLVGMSIVAYIVSHKRIRNR